MFTENGKISDRQIRRMGILENIPAPLLVIPYICLQYGGMITLFIGLLITFLYALLMHWIAQRTGRNGREFLNCCPWYLSILYVLRYGIRAGILLWFFSAAIKSFLMYDLNQTVILAVLAVVTLYGSGGNIESRGRTMEMVFMWTMIPLILAGLIGIWNLNWSEIGETFQLKQAGDLKTWTGALAVLAAGSAFELFLYTQQNADTGNPDAEKNGWRNFWFIIGLVIFAVLCGYLMIIGTLGAAYPAKDILNSLNVMESIGTGISGLRRIDYLVLTFLVVGIFAMISGYYFRGRQHFNQLFRSSRYGILGAVTIGLLSVLTALFCLKTKEPIDVIGRYLLWIDIPLSILLPLLVMVTGGRTKAARESAAAEQEKGRQNNRLLWKRGMLLIVTLFLGLHLCGCWYGEVSSIENQDYVSSVAIEQNKDQDTVYTFTVADLSEYGGKPGDSIGYTDSMVKAENLRDACRIYKEEYGKTLDLGHLQQVILQTADSTEPGTADTEEYYRSKLMDFCSDPSISKATVVEYPDGRKETLLQVIRKLE